jgi:hypothetical protein
MRRKGVEQFVIWLIVLIIIAFLTIMATYALVQKLKGGP